MKEDINSAVSETHNQSFKKCPHQDCLTRPGTCQVSLINAGKFFNVVRMIMLLHAAITESLNLENGKNL